MHTGLLRQQHHEIGAIVNDMRRHLLAPQRMTLATAESLSASLGALSAKLASHLSIEEKGLYPRLLAATGTPTAAVGRKFCDEMVAIVEAYHVFLAHWPDADRIHAERVRFVDECTTVFHDLVHRLDREEKELYPMADVFN